MDVRRRPGQIKALINATTNNPRPKTTSLACDAPPNPEFMKMHMPTLVSRTPTPPQMHRYALRETPPLTAECLYPSSFFDHSSLQLVKV